LKRKLLALNLALGALVIYAGWQLRQTREAARARESSTLNQRVPPAPPPPFTPLPAAPPVIAGGYSNVVQQTLFDRSRNPTVPIELPAPAPAPPPKPMPPLPVYHGMMNIGGITVVLSADANSPQQGIEIGESIGQFKLAAVNTEEITFEWDGQRITRKLDELKDHSGTPPPAAAATPVAAAPPAVRSEAPAPPPVQNPLGPGQDIGAGFRACQPNDSNPAGAVVDGYRKVVLTSPFGQTCRWDPAR
jgi:hypothetical protein